MKNKFMLFVAATLMCFMFTACVTGQDSTSPSDSTIYADSTPIVHDSAAVDTVNVPPTTPTPPQAEKSFMDNLLSARTISEILMLLGIGGFFVYRATKLKETLNMIIEAAEDGSVSEEEFRGIIASVKKIWSKKEATG